MRGAGPLAANALAALIGYGAATTFSAWSVEKATGIACDTVILTVTCAFEPDHGAALPTYGALAAGAVVLLLAARFLFRERAVYPFIGLISTVALGAMAFDVLAGRTILNAPKIANDTFGVLEFAVFSSLVLTFAIAREAQLRPTRVLIAILASFSATAGARFFYAAIYDQLGGAMELFFLFVLYAFGAFSLHLMSLSLMIASARVTPDG
jgi:hypothetical protein